MANSSTRSASRRKSRKNAPRRSRPRVAQRQAFLRQTYLHLLGAILAVVAIEVALFESGFADRLTRGMLSVNWLLILGAFMIAGWIARRMAYRLKSKAAQYAGLTLYVVAKALILVPLLSSVEQRAPRALGSAAQFTLIAAIGLTAIVYVTGKDFSFLRPFLIWMGFLSLIAIIAAVLFGIHLGMWFNLAMIALAGASILYDTDKVRRRYRNDRYVAASLELFASVAFMFWYALRLFRRLSSEMR